MNILYNQLNKLRKPSTMVKILGIPLLWYNIGLTDRDTIKKDFYQKGYQTSQLFKNVPVWDKYAEPFFGKQLSILFSSGNAFMRGMMSDNDDKTQVNATLNQMKKEIEKDLGE